MIPKKFVCGLHAPMFGCDGGQRVDEGIRVLFFLSLFLSDMCLCRVISHNVIPALILLSEAKSEE